MELDSFREYQNVIDEMEMDYSLIPNRHIVKKVNLKREMHKMMSVLGEVYENSIELNSLKESYMEFIHKICYFFKKLDISNPIVIFGVYSYLLKNGYLSFQHKFVYRKNIEDCYPLFGTNVIEGEGVCRHISAMLTDIYNEMGFVSYNLSSIFDRSIPRLLTQELNVINDMVPSASFTSRFLSYLIVYPPYNHLVTLVNSENGSLIIDATNDGIFFVNQKKQIVSVLNSNMSIECGFEQLFNKDTNYKLSELLVPTHSDSIYYLAFYYYQGYHFADSYCSYFEDFYQDNKNLYVDVVEQKRGLSKEFSRYILKKKL